MRNWIMFDNKTSKDYGMYISGEGTFNAPERDVSTVEIPGKNGTLTLDNKRFKNITVNYPSFIRTKFKENAKAARNWLLSEVGYRRLEDSYHKEYYRMARFLGPIDFETRFLNLSAEMELIFDCSPEKWLKSGEEMTTIVGTGKIYNPTKFEAKPLIRVHGTSGKLIVNNTMIDISEINEYVDIDSELMDAYKGIENKNQTITNEFPVLRTEENDIKTEGAITKIEIIPRWWEV